MADLEQLISEGKSDPSQVSLAGEPLAISRHVMSMLENAPDPMAMVCNTRAGTHLTWRAMRRGNVGVLRIQGEIWSAWSWSSLSDGLYALAEDADVDTIVLAINSPGGVWHGTTEFAAAVASMRDRYRVVAHVGGLGLSAAYVVAAAAEEIVLAQSAEVGCIGTMATFCDYSKWEEAAGIKRLQFVSSQTPRKNLDPATDAGAAALQEKLDAHAQVMIETIANYRGVSIETVLRDYGAGDSLVGALAIEAGLADSTGELEPLIQSLQTKGLNMAIRNLTQGGLYLATAVDQVEAVSELTRETLAALPGGEAVITAIENQARAAGLEEGRAQAASQDGDVESAVKAERTRIAEITALGSDGMEDIVKACIDSGKTVAEASLEILKACKERGVTIAGMRADAPSQVNNTGTPADQGDPWARSLSKMGVQA